MDEGNEHGPSHSADADAAPTEHPEGASTAERRFDWLRYARSDSARALLQEVLRFLSGLEHYDANYGSGGRRRARRLADQVNFERQVEALIGDLVVRYLEDPGAGVFAPRSKAELGRSNRYRPSFITEKLADVMDMLARPEMEFAELRLGQQRAPRRGPDPGTRTTLRAGSRLVGLIHEYGLTQEDFGLREDGEVIVLKARKADPLWGKARNVEYDDTPETDRMRTDLQRINRHVAAADVRYEPPGDGINTSRRQLVRIFSGTFDQHGRMYGAFWIDLPRRDRLERLRIDGAGVIELDYAQMAIRLQYAAAGKVPHFDDAYAVPGFEEHREGAKRMLNSMLASSRPLRRFPKNVRPLLPKGMSFATALAALTAYHAPIREHFYRDQSLTLMFRESEIMVRVLLRLVDQGITALPIHDGLLVAEHHGEAARTAMLECFREETGFEGIVKVERSRNDDDEQG